MRRHTVDVPRYDPADIPEENAERHDEDRLSVFEWYCPDCAEWLGWPADGDHAATACDEPGACSHADDGDACGHVVCGDCHALADSREWVLEGDAVEWVAQGIFEGVDIETAFRRALLADLQAVADGRPAEAVVARRRELFARYAARVEGEERQD